MENPKELLQQDVEEKALKIAMQLEGLSVSDIQHVLKEVENVITNVAVIKF